MLSIHANLKSILTYVILVWMVEVPIYYYCYPKMRLLLHFLLLQIVHLAMAGPFQTGIHLLTFGQTGEPKIKFYLRTILITSVPDPPLPRPICLQTPQLQLHHPLSNFFFLFCFYYNHNENDDSNVELWG